MAWCHNEVFLKDLHIWMRLPNETSDYHGFQGLCYLLDEHKEQNPNNMYRCISDITIDGLDMHPGKILYQTH